MNFLNNIDLFGQVLLIICFILIYFIFIIIFLFFCELFKNTLFYKNCKIFILNKIINCYDLICNIKKAKVIPLKYGIVTNKNINTNVDLVNTSNVNII